MQRRISLHRFSRSLHLYLGVFTTPAILFFALTGALQTFDLHETTRGSSYRPPHWIAAAAQWHKKQSVTLTPHKRPQPATTPGTRPPEKPLQAAHLPMKVFFATVSLSLFASTATGLVLAYRHHRNKLALSTALAAGVVVPVLLLLF